MVTAERRPSSAEGRFSGGASSCIGEGGRFSVELVDFVSGEGLLESSANSLLCCRVLHCREIATRVEGRLPVLNRALELSSSLGTERTIGCMAKQEQSFQLSTCSVKAEACRKGQPLPCRICPPPRLAPIRPTVASTTFLNI